MRRIRENLAFLSVYRVFEVDLVDIEVDFRRKLIGKLLYVISRQN